MRRACAPAREGEVARLSALLARHAEAAYVRTIDRSESFGAFIMCDCDLCRAAHRRLEEIGYRSRRA